jgi:hypothetical protein
LPSKKVVDVRFLKFEAARFVNSDLRLPGFFKHREKGSQSYTGSDACIFGTLGKSQFFRIVFFLGIIHVACTHERDETADSSGPNLTRVGSG